MIKFEDHLVEPTPPEPIDLRVASLERSLRHARRLQTALAVIVALLTVGAVWPKPYSAASFDSRGVVIRSEDGRVWARFELWGDGARLAMYGTGSGNARYRSHNEQRVELATDSRGGILRLTETGDLQAGSTQDDIRLTARHGSLALRSRSDPKVMPELGAEALDRLISSPPN